MPLTSAAPRVALATCTQFAQLDDDDQLLLRALRKIGVDAVAAVWDEASVDWTSFALTVVRETWDYSERRDEFLAWTRHVPGLLNAADMLEWNTDKHYLRYLQEGGVPVVETHWVEPPATVGALPLGGDVVVKPAVSAGSRNTERYRAHEHEAAQAHISRLLGAGRAVMVQPYVASVDTRGETALVYIDGAYSHAVNKGPILVRRNPAGGALFAAERISPTEPEPAELELGERVMQALPWPPSSVLYARVDVVAGATGEPQVLELELAEPSLFFTHDERAASRMAAAIVRRLADSGGSAQQEREAS